MQKQKRLIDISLNYYVCTWRKLFSEWSLLLVPWLWSTLCFQQLVSVFSCGHFMIITAFSLQWIIELVVATYIYIFSQQLPYFQFILLSFTLSGLAVAADQDFKTFQTAYPYVVRKLLTDNSAATRRILHSVSIHFLRLPHYITYAF